MKKLIVISILFALLLGFGIFEQIYVSNFFTDIHSQLMQVDERFIIDPEHIDNKETVDLIQSANDNWEKSKHLVMVVQHHGVVKYVDEKLVSLLSLAKMNQFYDANVTLQVLQSYIKDLRLDNGIDISNFL